MFKGEGSVVTWTTNMDLVFFAFLEEANQYTQIWRDAERALHRNLSLLFVLDSDRIENYANMRACVAFLT